MSPSRVLHRIGACLALLLFLGCPTSEERLEAVYVANGNVVAKNTGSMFDQSVQQGGYSLVSGLSDRVSVARFKSLTFVAWDVMARDATGGSPQDKIFVITTLGGAASSAGSAATLISGGVNADPALAAHGNRLYCMWGCGSDVCLSSTQNGSSWTAPIRKAPPNGAVAGIDLAEHSGHLYLAGVVGASGSKTLFASQINVTSSGNDFFFAAGTPNADVVPGDHPSDAEGVSLTSDGTTLWLGYVQGTASRLTSFNGSWSGAASVIDGAAGSRPALAFARGSLYACYRNGAALTVRRRISGAWEAGNPTVNDATANAALGIDCHKITVVTGS
jgi:hypothetical protein